MAIYSQVFETKIEHSAQQIGSGGLEVLSTPSLVAFMENACFQFTEESLNDSQLSTVGTEISIQHLKASKIGETVTIVITALKEEGRRYDFRLEAYVNEQMVAKACHTRVRIDVEKFLSKL
ncbi:diaminopimelate epimerase [Streptococcus penaeicida]|uniref:Diaminopimelate epimerase n=1 Tax=Streptococcus penaeicida TaxID=1765960 RepID=A0A2N8LCB4_9STRE|nr:thioesterase family protein [Streptococcus penaeicida]PND47799.1 diaminopimelate epimerase [Streptococcus penaeicida]